MPALAAEVAEAREGTVSVETLRGALDRLPPRFIADTDRIHSWLLRHNTSRPGTPEFELMPVDVFLRRWDVIRRLRFEVYPIVDGAKSDNLLPQMPAST